MADIQVAHNSLLVRLSPLEKIAALHRDIRVPLTSVYRVSVEPNPYRALRGVRAPGTGIPGVLVLGTLRFRGGKDFVAIYGRRPVVRIDFRANSAIDRLLVTTHNPEDIADMIYAAVTA